MLNPEQRQAATTTEGPVMVIAGPGTGKTHVLACRIAYILEQQDIDPANILALTFTDAAAKNMRERLVQMIGTAGYYVAIATFHSFCSEVIAQHPEYFDLDTTSQPLTDLEKYEVFEELLTSSKLQVLKPLSRPLYYLGTVQSQISNLKREGVSPIQFEEILLAEAAVLEQERDTLKKTALLKREKNLAKQKELLTLYIKYQTELQKRSRYDFDDMIMFVTTAFAEHEELLLEYQEKLQYILVDEYQDTNTAQNTIVDSLASWWGEQANVFVVGDPHQSIFRFQGASVENMLGFLERYPSAAVITLKTGYRCPQRLYDAAHATIVKNTVALETTPHSFLPEHDQVLRTALTTRLQSAQPNSEHLENELKLIPAQTVLIENNFIVSEISKLLKKGVEPQEIAVLYKNHADAFELQNLLVEEGIPFETDNSGNVLDDLYMQQLLKVMRVIHNLETTEESGLLFDVLLLDWLKLPRLAVFQTARIASKLRVPFVTVLEKKVDTLSAEFSLDVDGFVELQAFKVQLEKLHALEKNVLFTTWFETLISDEGGLGLFSWLVEKAAKKEHILALQTLFGEIKKWLQVSKEFGLQEFLLALDTMAEHGLVFKIQQPATTQNKVTLSSIHKAKGREWEYVFLMRLVDKKWGNTISRELLTLPNGILSHVDVSKLEKDEEDRRLFYVAITRAKKQTLLSYPKSMTEGKAVRNFVGSMFIEEVTQSLEIENEQALQLLAEQVEKKLLAPVSSVTPLDTTEDERAFFASLVENFTLSVTALNTYLRDPKEFVYNSLLKIPRAKLAHLSFGTAMHKALEDFYSSVDDTMGKTFSLPELHASFTKTLSKEALLDEEYVAWTQKGIDALSVYYQTHRASIKKPLFTERFFGGTFSKTILFDGTHQIPLSGRLDRIDLIDPLTKQVRLIDYKTGTAKSVNTIEAATQTSLGFLSEREQELPASIRGAYKRQLVFYVLLAELDSSFPYTVAETVFEFIEPTKTGKLVSRSFTISSQEVAELKNLIIEVMAEIRSLSFLEALTYASDA